jgi:Mn2+/Fe2+ NRAMP family transporter
VAGQCAFILFAVGLIGTGLLAIPILSGSAAYALKQFLNLPGGLASKPRYRPCFYLIILIATMGTKLRLLGVYRKSVRPAYRITARSRSIQPSSVG